MLEAKNLSCTRDERILFHGLNFCVRPGDLVQVAGTNGAGKTSLLRILAGLSQPDEGCVNWSGTNIHHYREYHQQLLFLGHQSGIKTLLTVWENLLFYHSKKYKCHSDIIGQILIQTGLSGYEDLPVAQLSAGQQRRVALARLWLSDVPLWILDEPLTAIDQQGRQQIILLFERHVAAGGMLLFTTHQDLMGIRKTVKKIYLTGTQGF